MSYKQNYAVWGLPCQASLSWNNTLKIYPSACIKVHTFWLLNHTPLCRCTTIFLFPSQQTSKLYMTLDHLQIKLQQKFSNRNVFSHNSEDWKYKTEELAGLFSYEDPLLGLQVAAFFLGPHKVFLLDIHTLNVSLYVQTSSSSKDTS